MAGSIADNAAVYKKTFTYVPPTPPAELVEATNYTLDFASRKFIHIGIDPTDNFETVIHLITSSRYVQITSDFLRRIFSLMGNILSFILDTPQSYKRTVFLETDFFKLSSMVYSGANVLVIESKTREGCRILLNRLDLIQLQELEWCIYTSIEEKDSSIKPRIFKQMTEFSKHLGKKCLQEDSPPKNAEEMELFIKKVEVRRVMYVNPNLSQIKLFASKQLAEFCMDHLREAQNSQVVYDENFKSLSTISPSYSPVNAAFSLIDDSTARDGFNQPDFTKPHDQWDGPQSPEEMLIQQPVDENDGPDFYNEFMTPPSSQLSCIEPSAPLRKRIHTSYAEHPTPLREVKRRLF